MYALKQPNLFTYKVINKNAFKKQKYELNGLKILILNKIASIKSHFTIFRLLFLNNIYKFSSFFLSFFLLFFFYFNQADLFDSMYKSIIISFYYLNSLINNNKFYLILIQVRYQEEIEKIIKKNKVLNINSRSNIIKIHIPEILKKILILKQLK